MADNGQNGTKKVGAVMVVGGGIAGMQASIDLVHSGFKVYLVEETSSIGGRMSQLDKTFPTNDCSMCLISPRLIEVGKNLNVELLTNSRVQSVEGEEGHFSVKVLKTPRYIDETKCSGCGDCAEACPVSLSSEFDQGLTTRKAVHKRYPQAIPSTFSISKAGTPPCRNTCPAGCNGQGYAALTAQGKYIEALDLIKQRIPLPATLGRICHHPCEAKCNRGEVDAPVALAPLKRFLADKVRQDNIPSTVPKPEIDGSKPKVAVIGAGPSGLTCAADLAKLGYPVTVFEAGAAPGGQLHSAIPKYRLPKDILAAEIKDIIDSGIELRLNTNVGKDIGIEDIKKQYKATYVAIGAQKSRSLPIPGIDLPGVWLALDLLRAVNAGKQVTLGQRVVVVGGGNVAMDVARTARRLGAQTVQLCCLESRPEMPAHPWEIEDAETEGVLVNPSWGPTKITGTSGKAGAVEFRRCTAVFDEKGAFSPKFDDSITTRFECDSVVIAIGQGTDLSLLPPNGNIKTSRGGFIIADALTLATDEPGVFAGGEGVTGPKSAVEAIKHGHEAAVSIDRYLRGVSLTEGRVPVEEKIATVPAGEHEKKARNAVKKIDLAQRLAGFDEVELCLNEDEARNEARRCLNCGLCSECLQCVAVCKAKAVDHAMKPQVLDIEVGSIIMATGFEPFDASIKGEFGYGRMPNVVTSLEFERILSASGPFQGQVRRPSDGRHPVKVAWLQCVGSRDKACGRDYCSSVCCMYATKQAIIAREHDSKIQPAIFYNDMRAFGKGFERYFESARGKNQVKYVKSMISTVKELQQSKNLLLEYIGEGGKKVQEEFDMVVLSVGLVPSASSRELAAALGVKTDRFGFCQTDEFNPNTTSRPGVYVAGALEGPMDIPESVMSGSSAACLAAEKLSDVRGTMLKDKTYPSEIEVHDEPRIGVFICRCGANIARVVDVPGVAAYAATLPHVVHAEENLYTCSTDTQGKIVRAIQEKRLNRIVVASCSPRTHEPLFQETIREAGLNRFLFEMANIRDQCSWVHASHPDAACDKAKDLVRMAVARAATLKPLQQAPSPVKQKALVIGGGLAGMTAALELAGHGIESLLLEKEPELGGNLKNIYYTAEGADPRALLASLVSRVRSEPLIKVHTGAQIRELSGYLGNYRTGFTGADGKPLDYEHGVVIVATGGVEYQPTEYLYGKAKNVLTQHELEAKVGADSTYARSLKSVAMVQCVGSREGENMYCSRVCCTQAVKNALRLKKDNPALDVYVLYRDIRTYGKSELFYQQARDAGVVFIRYDVESKPEVIEDNGKLAVNVFDTVLGETIRLSPDVLVLSTAIRPQPDAGELASRLRLPLTQEGFFMEAHMKLRPLDFVSEGMYLCGLAHSPKSVTETISQARGAVARAMTVLAQPHLMTGGVVSVVDPERCAACLTCVRACPYNVPHITEDKVAYIEAAACQGCGICAGACPRKAIKLQHYEDEQVTAKTAVLYV